MRIRRSISDTDTKKAIIQTLIYSDLFDFPLTQTELWTFLKSNTKVSKKQFIDGLTLLEKARRIERGKYFTLPGRQSLTKKREANTQINKDKFILAKKYSHLLSKIPTILYIGISGSVAMGNAHKDDDIDLFIITTANSLWITRSMVLFILEKIGERRSKKDTLAVNKCCVNMLITEDNLSLPIQRHDIYTAHEIAQLATLYNKNQTYERFLCANSWINDFLPNISVPTLSAHYTSNTFQPFISILDGIAQVIQLYSIKKTRTTETIQRRIVAFHPNDNRIKTLAQYSKAQKIHKTKL